MPKKSGKSSRKDAGDGVNDVAKNTQSDGMETEKGSAPGNANGSGNPTLQDDEKIVIKIFAGPGPGSNAQQQHYFQPAGLPPGYVPTQHFGQVTPPLQGGVLGHAPPQSQPGMGFHKDERTQRQHNRLKRKLEQKQTLKGDAMAGLGGSSAHGTPPTSPRKDVVNGLRSRMGTGKERGMSSVGTSEDGEESSSLQDEEDEVEVITEMLSSVHPPQVNQETSEKCQAQILTLLSSIHPPQVTELNSTSALLHWTSPEGLMDLKEEYAYEDLRFEVLLSDKGKDGRYKSIYSGLSHSCRIQDLQPGKEYSVCLLVHLEDLRGQASEPTTFTTPPCRPDPPPAPRMCQRTRFNLQLRWGAAHDNGAQVQHYILECDSGQGVWSEIHRTRSKQHNLAKLQPATPYKFRLAAVNECGKSNYSEVVTYSTAGNLPPPPAPPILRAATVNSLHLAWVRRPGDEEFVLQMDDRHSNYGFLPVYSGRDTQYTCERLRRHTEFKFRLRSSNEEGPSRWSDEVSYRTLPSCPAAPPRPTIKGRVHHHSFKVKWEPPHDKGGADITSFTLELSADKGNYQQVYHGPHTEHVCDRLNPGSLYMVRVCCAGPGGRSDYSEPCTVTTDAVCPGQCQPPRLHGKPRATSLSLKWNYPPTDGGAPLSQFELEMSNAANNNSRRQAYVGRDTECIVQDLAPGQNYIFQLRACNRVGPGKWSEPLKVQSGAAPPEVPQPPQAHVSPRSPPGHAGNHMTVLVTWVEPANNGSPITEYQLQVGSIRPTSPSPARSTSPSTRPVSPASSVSSNSAATPNIPASPVRPVRPSPSPLEPVDVLDVTALIERRLAYQGPATSAEVKNLSPATIYHFRLQAANSSGWSGWSADCILTTPPGPPAAPSSLRSSTAPYSINLTWSTPAANGSPILHYQIDLGDRSVCTEGPETQLTVDQLKPQTQYRVRVRAVNAVGPGPYSSAHRCSTRPLPPAPPSLECVTVGHNHLKLKWGDGRNPDFTQYIIEMDSPRTSSEQWQSIYQGTNHTYKVNRLQELTTYRFRIAAASDAGVGDFSDVYEFTTCIAPPPSLKQPKASEILQRSCLVEWVPCRPTPSDPIEYQLQLCRLRDQDFKVVYRGPDTKATLDDLEPGAEYEIRVCSVRCTSSGDLQGAYSPATTFSTQAPEQPAPVVRAPLQQATQPKPMTDKQWAAIILSGFTFFAFLLAVILHHFLG